MKVVKAIDKIERVIIAALFAIMVLAVFGQVVNRNIFKLQISWFEELARGCMVYALMLGTDISIREHAQLNVDSLVRRLPAKISGILEYVSVLATIAYTGIVGFTSIRMIQSMAEMGTVMPAMQIPKWIFQFSVTLGCLLIFLTQVIILVNTLASKAKQKKSGEA